MKKVYITLIALLVCGIFTLSSVVQADAVSKSNTTVRVVYKEDGSVSVIHPAPNSKRSDESKAEWLQRVFEDAMADPKLNGLLYDDIDVSQLPENRKFRSAWVGSKGSGVFVDPTKAAEIQAKLDAEKIEE